MWTTPGDDDDTTMVSKNISFSSSRFVAREQCLRGRLNLIGRFLVVSWCVAFFLLSPTLEFFFPQTASLHFITLSPEKESLIKDKYGRRAKDENDVTLSEERGGSETRWWEETSDDGDDDGEQEENDGNTIIKSSSSSKSGSEERGGGFRRRSSSETDDETNGVDGRADTGCVRWREWWWWWCVDDAAAATKREDEKESVAAIAGNCGTERRRRRRRRRRRKRKKRKTTRMQKKKREEEEEEADDDDQMDVDDEEDAFEERRKIDADEKYEADWTDKKQYFPIDLAVFDAQKKAEAMSINDAAKIERDNANGNEEEKKGLSRKNGESIAQTLDDLRSSKGEKLVAWQLPPDLPLANERNGRNRNSATAAGRNNNRRGGKRTSAGAGNATNSSNKNKKQKKLLGVPDLRAGQLGEIEVYADGTAKFVIGECRFDLKDGTAYRHHEQFNIIDEKKKKCAFVGDIVGLVVATPDVDQLIEQSSKEQSYSDEDDENLDGDSDVDIIHADSD